MFRYLGLLQLFLRLLLCHTSQLPAVPSLLVNVIQHLLMLLVSTVFLAGLPAAAVLYLSTVASSVLVTGGRDERAWQVLEDCSDILVELHEAGADAAVWHAAAGVALYHCDDLQVGAGVQV